MQAYVKKVKIVPELDLSLFEQQLGSIPKEFGKFMDDLRKPFDDLQKDFTINVEKNEDINKTETNKVVNKVETIEEPLTVKPEPITKRKNQVIMEEKVRDKVESQNSSKIDSEAIIKEINKGLEKESYLSQKGASNSEIIINDFFKGLQKELQFTPEAKGKTIKLERIDELDKLIKYLEESGNKIEYAISGLKEDLTEVEGYEYYQQNQQDVAQLEANKKEIARLKLSGKDDAATLNKIEELKEANEKLDERIRSFDVIKDDFKEMIAILSSIEELDAKYNDLWKDKEEAEEEKEDLKSGLESGDGGGSGDDVDWEAVGEKVGSMISSAITGILTSYIDMWGDILKGALEEFDRMSQYSLDTSLRVNSEAREQALMYGLSDAQNYALTRTKEEMGISSEEDMLMMTPAQQERFAERIGYYSDQYTQISNEGLFAKYEEYQAAVQEFQNEFQMEVIEFFAQNKDTIITVMNFIMDVMSALLDAVTWIVDALGGDDVRTEKENSAIVSDTINSYSVANNNSTNVKIDNSFTNIPVKDQQQYVKAGQKVNEQLINALDGRLGG